MPTCLFCSDHGKKVDAEFVAAQSEDLGLTVNWVLICQSHTEGWNDGGDWIAPIFRLGRRIN